MKFFECDVCGRKATKEEIKNGYCPRCKEQIIKTDGGYIVKIEITEENEEEE